jgi:hypothetical protein
VIGMADTPITGDSPEQAPLDERLERAIAVAYGQHGYVTDDVRDDEQIVVLLLNRVLQAEVHKTAERAQVAVPKRELMTLVWPQVAGPEAWAEQDDPELAEALYMRLESNVWSFLRVELTGQVQDRLNGAHGLVLCRTKVNPHKTDAVYVTRDWKCIAADYAPKYTKAAERAATKLAMQLALVAERIPDHGKRSKTVVTDSLKQSLTSGTTTMDRALQAGESTSDE